MLIASLVDLYETQWLGAADAARERGASLITFVGRELAQPQGFQAAANAVYDLVSAERLDGLVVWTTSLFQYVGPERTQEFVGRLGDLPIASVERSLPGVPSIVMSDRAGMKEAVTHLIEVHGHRRIAFVRGSSRHHGARERYQGYLAALAEHGIAVDDDLISAWSEFYSAELSAWIERLVVDTARRPDAVAVAHDDWALGVLSVLKASEVSVPRDAAVVAFDDVLGVRRHSLWLDPEGRDTLSLVDLEAAMLPLTTVHAPFPELAAAAVESLLARLRGETVPDVVTVPTRLVVRRSCGCVPSRERRRGRRAASVPRTTEMRLTWALEASLPPSHPGLPEGSSRRLAEALVADVGGKSSEAFVAEFEEVAYAPQLGLPSLLAWFRALAALRREVAAVMSGEAAARAEALVSTAEDLLAQMAGRFATYQRLWGEKDNEVVRRIGQKVIGALDVATLSDVLADELPNLEIAACYLAAYTRDRRRVRSLLAYERGSRIELPPGERVFPAMQLIPGGRIAAEEPRSLVVLPLHFKREQLGFVVAEPGPRIGWIYETLQEQLSSSVEAALLVERQQAAAAALQKARDELEQRVAERTAELARANETLTKEMMERARAEETRAALENQLRLAQKMEALGRLAGGIAHDFNNLLVVISGYSDLVLERVSPDDPIRPDVEAIRQAGEQATGLTRQLLAFGRQQVLEPRVLDLNEVVAGVETMLRRLIGEDVELVVRLAPSLPPVRADEGQIVQVIVNLTLNARDAMPTGGQLTIATDGVVLGAHDAELHPSLEPGRYAALTVRDTGVGMDAETQARIFEPFFTTKGPGGGTGLGLATVFGIVRQSGGLIDLESRPNEGTTFRALFPRATRASDEREPTLGGPETEARGSETILLVEDEPSVRRVVRRFLEQRGYTVLDAPDGAAAERVFEERLASIDLVVTDVVMPDTSGPELIDRLVRRRPGIPVLYVSGYTAGVISRQGLPEGAVALLEKPFTPEALGRKVRELLDREGTARPLSSEAG